MFHFRQLKSARATLFMQCSWFILRVAQMRGSTEIRFKQSARENYRYSYGGGSHLRAAGDAVKKAQRE